MTVRVYYKAWPTGMAQGIHSTDQQLEVLIWHVAYYMNMGLTQVISLSVVQSHGLEAEGHVC